MDALNPIFADLLRRPAVLDAPRKDDRRALADRLDNALQSFAHDNGDGFHQRDWRGAYDVRDEGYEVAEEAFKLPEDERSFFIEKQVDEAPEGNGWLLLCAAEFRLAELSEEAADLAAARQRKAAA